MTKMLIGLKVKAGAKANAIGDYVVIDGKKYLKLSIKAPAENGKANIEIIRFLSDSWNIPKKNLEIVTGHGAQIKILSIAE